MLSFSRFVNDTFCILCLAVLAVLVRRVVLSAKGAPRARFFASVALGIAAGCAGLFFAILASTLTIGLDYMLDDTLRMLYVGYAALALFLALFLWLKNFKPAGLRRLTAAFSDRTITVLLFVVLGVSILALFVFVEQQYNLNWLLFFFFRLVWVLLPIWLAFALVFRPGYINFKPADIAAFDRRLAATGKRRAALTAALVLWGLYLVMALLRVQHVTDVPLTLFYTVFNLAGIFAMVLLCGHVAAYLTRKKLSGSVITNCALIAGLFEVCYPVCYFWLKNLLLLLGF